MSFLFMVEWTPKTEREVRAITEQEKIMLLSLPRTGLSQLGLISKIYTM